MLRIINCMKSLRRRHGANKQLITDAHYLGLYLTIYKKFATLEKIKEYMYKSALMSPSRALERGKRCVYIQNTIAAEIKKKKKNELNREDVVEIATQIPKICGATLSGTIFEQEKNLAANAPTEAKTREENDNDAIMSLGNASTEEFNINNNKATNKRNHRNNNWMVESDDEDEDENANRNNNVDGSNNTKTSIEPLLRRWGYRNWTPTTSKHARTRRNKEIQNRDRGVGACNKDKFRLAAGKANRESGRLAAKMGVQHYLGARNNRKKRKKKTQNKKNKQNLNRKNETKKTTK